MSVTYTMFAALSDSTYLIVIKDTVLHMRYAFPSVAPFTNMV